MLLRRNPAALAAAVLPLLTSLAACAARTTEKPATPVLASLAAVQQTEGGAPTGTRALYHYRRADGQPETRIHIVATHRGETPLSPNVMGNFIEHLGNVVYQILWANAVMNPSMEKIGDKDAAPPMWRLDGGATWQDGGYLSPRGVRLEGAAQGVSQRVYLPEYRVRQYTLTFYARAVSGGGQVTATVRGGDEGMRGLIVSQTVTAATGAWGKQTIHWTLPAGALQKGAGARFSLHGGAGGAVDVDQVELFPDDAVEGMDPDVIKAAKAWNIPILRLAGNFSSGYHWRDGVGPRLQRPTQRNVAWGDAVETNHFGTDEFADFGKLIGNVPLQIAVNAGNGTPAEAADWVRYCESKNFPVTVWEIGNELYGGWQIGHTDPAGNAARYVAFRSALSAVEPNLTLMATGKADEFLPAGVGRDRDWNTAVLQAATANGGKAPAYLTIHPLVPLPGDLGVRPYGERWESAMAHPTFMDQTLFPELIREIQAAEGPNSTTRIAPTEWGIIVGGQDWFQGPNHNVEAGAIYNSLALNAFLRNGDWVTLANMTALLHGGCIKKEHGVVYVDPQYYTQKMYADAGLRTPVETDWAGPGRDVPQRGFLPAATDVPDVDVFSALSKDGARLTVFAVNRTLNDARPVRIALDGFAPGRVTGTILAATDPQASNGWDKPDVVAPQPFVVSPGDGQSYAFTIPAHSLVEVTFVRKVSR
jgi:alpha-N-arabinofuranosidase